MIAWIEFVPVWIRLPLFVIGVIGYFILVLPDDKGDWDD